MPAWIIGGATLLSSALPGLLSDVDEETAYNEGNRYQYAYPGQRQIATVLAPYLWENLDVGLTDQEKSLYRGQGKTSILQAAKASKRQASSTYASQGLRGGTVASALANIDLATLPQFTQLEQDIMTADQEKKSSRISDILNFLSLTSGAELTSDQIADIEDGRNPSQDWAETWLEGDESEPGSGHYYDPGDPNDDLDTGYVSPGAQTDIDQNINENVQTLIREGKLENKLATILSKGFDPSSGLASKILGDADLQDMINKYGLSDVLADDYIGTVGGKKQNKLENKASKILDKLNLDEYLADYANEYGIDITNLSDSKKMKLLKKFRKLESVNSSNRTTKSISKILANAA